MRKNFGKAGLFLGIFLALFLLISPVFVPKNNSGTAGIHNPQAKGFLAEPEDTLDVLFVGDSEAYSAFIPLQLWENYGITSYVCSSGDQMIYQCYSYVDRAFDTQSPKAVVLETNTLYRPFTLAQLMGHWAEEAFPYLRYHDRWKNLQPGDFTGNVEFTHSVPNKGYYYKTETTVTDTEGYMAPSDEAEPVNLVSGAYVRRLRDFCREQGAQLILVSTPSPTNWSSYYHNGVAQLAQELDIPYIDMNLMPREVPIDWSCESYDGGDHLNYSGAGKVTHYMGQYLWETGLFEDKRENPEYAAWQEALAAFRDSMDN